ncbi:MAG: 2-oxoglutarate ferredoxin oxidoreductase subunit beta [Vicingaceae bacterium]|nr:MAG: 2-oxoglutarate ferredoxin oxidoreductase subunit beta [Vicingaceae bacterium]
MTQEDITTKNATIQPKDFASDQDVRWCPGCGDYSILKQTQTILAEIGIPRENIVFVSGIGCSSRFPYYLNTYGMHTIHGRAPAIATGIKLARPELSVWIITGDGDALSIGGNHLIHILRRNVNIPILLFNNEIYGLTKGQYSPTSKEGMVSKSTPYGSLDHPFNPVLLAMGAEATFVARTMDRDPAHLREILKAGHLHKGSAFIEIYQNCNVFNDGAFEIFTEKDTKPLYTLFLEEKQPLVFGKNREWGIRLDGYKPQIVSLQDSGFGLDDLWIHDSRDRYKAQILATFFDDPRKENALPRPFGIIYQSQRPCYEDLVYQQIENVKGKNTKSLKEIIFGTATWEVH